MKARIESVNGHDHCDFPEVVEMYNILNTLWINDSDELDFAWRARCGMNKLINVKDARVLGLTEQLNFIVKKSVSSNWTKEKTVFLQGGNVFYEKPKDTKIFTSLRADFYNNGVFCENQLGVDPMEDLNVKAPAYSELPDFRAYIQICADVGLSLLTDSRCPTPLRITERFKFCRKTTPVLQRIPLFFIWLETEESSANKQLIRR